MARQHQAGPGLPRSPWRGLAIALVAVPVVAFVVIAANVSPGLAFTTALLVGCAELWFVRCRPAAAMTPQAAASFAAVPVHRSRLHRLLFPPVDVEPWDPDAELVELMRRDREVPPGA
ncbi:MAG: hypothetical protein ACTHMZ_15120 [Actinomycetes bacterium]